MRDTRAQLRTIASRVPCFDFSEVLCGDEDMAMCTSTALPFVPDTDVHARMLRIPPSQRITAEEALNHPYVAQVYPATCCVCTRGSVRPLRMLRR